MKGVDGLSCSRCDDDCAARGAFKGLPLIVALGLTLDGRRERPGEIEMWKNMGSLTATIELEHEIARPLCSH